VPCSEDSDISTHCRSHCLWPQSASQAEPHFCSRVMSHPQGHICELEQATTRVGRHAADDEAPPPSWGQGPEWLETALGPTRESRLAPKTKTPTMVMRRTATRAMTLVREERPSWLAVCVTLCGVTPARGQGAESEESLVSCARCAALPFERLAPHRGVIDEAGMWVMH